MNETSLEADPRVLVVVVTHNGGPWLATCLDSLNYQIYPRMDVLVVDNGSLHEVAPTVARYAQKAELVRSERNLGFGAAANAGLEASSRTGSADYFLFLHDDVVLDPDAITMLVETALATGAGVVGGKGLDWDRPQVLVEVGMSADQFCAPYSGLEAGEIDQGQHEDVTETLFVSNACMLVARSLAERCGLWDGAYFAFGEDLDLCLRARLSGFKVVFEPAARYRHAAAWSSGRRRLARGTPPRDFLARRNQLRTIAKNAARPWMVLALIACVVVGSLRMMALLIFRRAEEVRHYPRALSSFLQSFPNLMVRRRAVQKRRTVSDRQVRSHMVKDTQRFRAQLERRLRQVERGTLAIGARTMSNLSYGSLKHSFIAWVRQPLTLATGLVVLMGLIAMRSTIFGGPIGGGTLWPFPDATNRLMGDYLSGWRDSSLGTQSAAPAAYPILWVVSLMGLGRPLLTQKLVILILMGLGLVGMNRLVRALTRVRAARVAAVALYALSPVTALIVSTGDLGAMAMFAGLPFVLALALRMLASGAPTARGPGYREPVPADKEALITASGRLALIMVPVVALAPSSLVALLVLLAVLGMGRALDAELTPEAWGRFRYVMLSVPVAAAVLIPWTLEGLRPSGPILGPLFSGLGGWLYPVWEGHTFQQMFLLDAGPGLAPLVAASLVLGALTLTGAARRAEARVLASCLLVFALLGALAAKGVLPPLVASPAMWLTVPLLLVAALAGLLIAGLYEELPEYTFGWRHKIAIPGLALALAAGLLVGWAPQLAGWGRAQPSFAAGTGDVASSIATFMRSTAANVGDFRVLWLGQGWVDPVRPGLRATGGVDYFVTSSEGLSILESVPPPPAQGEKLVDDVITAMMARRLHLAGHLLAPASVRFIVADPQDGPTMEALVRQRDIALEQQQEGVAVFRNLQWLPRAVLAPIPLTEEVIAADDLSTLMRVDWVGGRAIPARSPTRFTGELPRTAHSQVLLGDNFNAGWSATVDGTRLAHTQAFGWSNRFALEAGAAGEIQVHYARHWIRFLWLLVQVVILLSVVAMAGTAPPRPAVPPDQATVPLDSRLGL